MATIKEIAAFEAALQKLQDARPDLTKRLGEAPSRARLLEALEEVAPAIAPGMRSASRTQLLEAIFALAPAPQAEPLQSFTTRLPQSLVAEIKTAAANHPGGVQALVKAALQEYLKG